jgi:hypothetical protein
MPSRSFEDVVAVIALRPMRAFGKRNANCARFCGARRLFLILWSCEMTSTVTPRQIAAHLRKFHLGCNCDLDNWEPEQSTGHSWVCRIHKAALAASDQLKAEVAAAIEPPA